MKICILTILIISVGYLTSLIGYVFAWPSFTTAILQNVTTTPLDEPVTNSQINLLGSLTNIGALIATPFCGIIIEKLGRKYAAMVFGLPFVVSIILNMNLKPGQPSGSPIINIRQ